MSRTHSFAQRLLVIALLMITGVALVAESASAGAPVVQRQAPGYYRLALGAFEVTALNDGTIDFPMDKLLVGESPANIAADYRKAFQKLPAETSMNQFLINTGDRLVLVDTGAGGFYGPTLGNMIHNLRAAGCTPEQVDDVLITHMHADHIGGLVKNGQRVFPNAVLHVNKVEYDYWMNRANRAGAPEAIRSTFDVAPKMLNPYLAAGKLQLFQGATRIVPGIRAIPEAGHTPGHSFFVVESRGATLVLWGDVVHSAPVQFHDPSVRIVWDSDGRKAEHVREAAFADAAAHGYLIGAAHLPFPSFGHVARTDNGKGYRYVPLNYTQNRPAKDGGH
jgi:glyoxylase-like metal-dependent hydrolase (beta-lactamase superfamily II)